MKQIFNQDDDMLKFYSKKCLNAHKSISGVENYLYVLDQILNYDENFYEINEHYEKFNITKNELEALNAIDYHKEKISLCMIVRDEEKFIKRNLDNHVRYFNEIIILDTGSTDSTMSILKKYEKENSNIKIYTANWENDFSKARNYAKSFATNNWILFLDADEIISKKDIEKLFKIAAAFKNFKFKEYLAFAINVLNVEQNIEITTMQRFFYNSKFINYYGIIHEYVVVNSEIANFSALQLNIRIKHYGYKKSIIKEKEKSKRNIELLEIMLNKDPDNLRWLYYYTRESIGIVADEKLIECIENTINISKIKNNGKMLISDYELEILYNLHILYLRQNKYDACLNIMSILEKNCGEKYDIFFNKIYLQLLIYRKDISLMLVETLKYRKKHFERNVSYIDNDGYHIDLLIAVLLFEMGDFKKSKKYFDFLNGKINIKNYFPILEEAIHLLDNY